MAQEIFQNGATLTTLNGSITNSQTTLVVTSATGFPSSGNFRIRIDAEVMKVTGVSGTTFTIVRAQEGTSGSSHSSGVDVNYFLTKGALQAVRAEMVQVGAFGSRPSSARTGAIYVSNDGYYLSRYNGSSWDVYGPALLLTPPGNSFDSNYSWVDQGSATFTQNGDSWILKAPAETSGTVRKLVKSAPSTPYHIELGLRFLHNPTDYASSGFLWRKSSDNAHIHGGVGYHTSPGSHILLDKYNTDNSYAGTYVTAASSPRYGGLLNYVPFFRFTDDGIYRSMEISWDLIHWITYHFVVRADFATMNQVGFGIQNSNNIDTYMEVFHYREY